jgi:hypothetical protein
MFLNLKSKCYSYYYHKQHPANSLNLRNYYKQRVTNYLNKVIYIYIALMNEGGPTMDKVTGFRCQLLFKVFNCLFEKNGMTKKNCTIYLLVQKKENFISPIIITVIETKRILNTLGSEVLYT